MRTLFDKLVGTNQIIKIYFTLHRAIQEMVKRGQETSDPSTTATSEFTELKRESDEKVTFNLQTANLKSGLFDFFVE